MRARGSETEIEGGSGLRSEGEAGEIEIEGESERVDNDPADTNSNYPSGESVSDDRKRKTMFVCVYVMEKKGEMERKGERCGAAGGWRERKRAVDEGVKERRCAPHAY